MTIPLQTVPMIVFVGVVLCWFVFAIVFLLRKKPPQPPERKRDRASIYGIILQGAGYALAWAVHRPYFSPIVPLPQPAEVALAATALLLAAGSVWLVMSAVRTLGKQWSFAARLVDEHRLVIEGPYQWVRNPIYTGMLGMLVATGLAVSHWLALVGALALFGIGTAIRVRSEEKLLREAFGEEFEVYARRVPALLPRWQ